VFPIATWTTKHVGGARDIVNPSGAAVYLKGHRGYGSFLSLALDEACLRTMLRNGAAVLKNKRGANTMRIPICLSAYVKSYLVGGHQDFLSLSVDVLECWRLLKGTCTTIFTCAAINVLLISSYAPAYTHKAVSLKGSVSTYQPVGEFV
jgi:hypothetical protein